MQVGIAGLGRMGAGMARRAARGGHDVVAWNRTESVTAEIAAEPENEGRIAVAEPIERLLEMMAAPRHVVISVPSGAATDAMIEQLAGLLEPGDVIIDAGNSRFHDSKRHAAELAEKGIEWLDMGGGFAVNYKNPEQALPVTEHAKQLIPLLQGKPYKLAIEPGRYIVGNAGIVLTRVLYRKQGGEKRFVIVDAGMNDLIRPTLYEAYYFYGRAAVLFHFINPLLLAGSQRGFPVPVVGGNYKHTHLHAQARQCIANFLLHFRCAAHHAIVF